MTTVEIYKIEEVGEDYVVFDNARTTRQGRFL